jgi:hypothetical protein
MTALALNRDVTTCALAGKRQYETRQDAMRALFNARTAQLNGNSKRHEQRFYRCEDCHDWHLTSQAAPSYQRTDDVRQSAAVLELAARNHANHR